LFIVATPIGHLGDITRRAIATLAAADRVLAEDTRVARKLCSLLGIAVRRVERHDDRSDPRSIAGIVDAIRGGESVALISDAGTPLISDPGYRLVRAVREAGLPVTIAPGPSAPIAALAISGLPADRFYFAGFLSAKAAARHTELITLRAIDATLIILESPTRLATSLAAMAADLGSARRAVVLRELTKLYEETRAGTLAELAAHFAEREVKGEIVIVIAPPDARDATIEDDDAVDRHLDDALATMSLRDAAAAVAGATGRAKREVYARALARAAAKR
jgi:16S rRNA (cytidine1402-2'-O)-methyltransferase